MKVKLYAADMGGCGHYRLIWPGEAAKAEGLDVDIITEHTGEGLATLGVVCMDHPVTKVPVVVDTVNPACDVMVLQRPLSRLLCQTIPFVQARGTAVVVEVDDDFHAIHPHNAAYLASDPKQNVQMNRDWLMRACQMADLVTVSTPALAERYAPHGRYVILPNLLPAHAFNAPTDPALRPPDGRTWVGWSGTIATHPDDLQVTRQAVPRQIMRDDAGLFIVGPGTGVREAFGYPDTGAYHVTGWQPLDAYHSALTGMDIGVVPLADTAFNRAKSWLKGMEMAAAGIPFVATGTDEYLKLAEHGAGVIASHPRQWSGALHALITNLDYRQTMGAHALAAVSDLRYDENVHRWQDAWLVALANHAMRRHTTEYGMAPLPKTAPVRGTMIEKVLQ